MLYNLTVIYIPIVAGIVSLGGLIVAATLYIRAINALSVIIREEKPLARSAFFSDGKPQRSDVLLGNYLQGVTLLHLLLGATVLDQSNERCRHLLRMARKWLIVCLILFMADVIGIGWFFQNSRWPV